MKSMRSMLPMLVVAAVIYPGCASTVSRSPDLLAESEDKALTMLGDDINAHHVRLLNQKVGVFNFTSMDWTTSAAGKRISARLYDYLKKTGKLRMVPRTELERMMKKEAIEQAGMYDTDVLQKRDGMVPVDAVVFGTIENAGDAYEIVVRVMDVKTGRRLLLTGVRMPPTGEITSKASPDLLLLNRKSPGKVIAINRTYYMLAWMKARQPLVFLLVVLKDSEVESLETGGTVLGAKLKVRKDRYQRERPEVIEKIGILKDGLALINRYAPRRSSDIARWKKELLDYARK